MKKRILLIPLVLLLVASLVACAAPAQAPAPAPTVTVTAPAPAQQAPAAASTETVTWIGNWGAVEKTADGLAYMPGGRFYQLLLERSNGRFKVEVRERMVPREQELDFYAANKAQIGDMSITYVAGTYPLLDIGALPFRFSDPYQYESFVKDPEMLEILEMYYRDIGLQYLGQIPAGAMKYVFSKPGNLLSKVSDFSGLKLRTTGAAATLAFELLGAAPVSIPGPEMTDALYRGVVDAAVCTLDYGISQGLPELAPILNVWQVMPLISTALVANAEAFDALPADLQQILKDVANEVTGQQYYADKIQDLAFGFAAEIMELQFNYPSTEEVAKAVAMTKPVVDEWLKVAGPYGPKALEISAKYIK